MAQLTLRWLGTPQIENNGHPVQTDRRKAVALLAYLSLNPKPHRRESLAALLWPDYDQSRASAYLRRTLWEVNQMIGENWVIAGRETIQLVQSPEIWVDGLIFEQLMQEKQNPEKAVDRLQEITMLYRGTFLEGFTLRDSPNFDDWQFTTGEMYRRKYGESLRALAEACAAQNELDAAIAHTHRWLHLDPLDETAHRHLMQLYALTGQRNTALRQYETCKRLLEEELGAAPSPETAHLAEQIRMGEIQSASQPARPAIIETAARPQPKMHLPPQTTPFVGREAELAEIAGLLLKSECRLLTLAGQGGTGKTRLSIETAARLANKYEHGVYFIPLAAVTTEEAILPALAEGLGINLSSRQPGARELSNRPSEDAPVQIADYLRHKQILLIFDNMEHLVEAAGLLSYLLQEAPLINIVVTSRERLNLPEEWIFDVGGLKTPENIHDPQFEQYSAVRLFLQTAQRVQPQFTLTEFDKTPILRICQLVGGLPLGIELAAAWVRMLPCQDIADEIEKNLDFLSTRQRGVPDRHRSLRAAFDHSWNLLTETERRIFTKLTVFHGGFNKEAAAQVAGASLSMLTTLMDKSLLHRDPFGRYELHELLKQFGEQELMQSPSILAETRLLHSLYYLNLLNELASQAQGKNQKQARLFLNIESDNIFAAWNNILDQHNWPEIFLHSANLYFFCDITSRYQQGLAAVQAAYEKLQPILKAGANSLDVQKVDALFNGLLNSLYLTLEKEKQAIEYQSRAFEMISSLPPSYEKAILILLGANGFHVLTREQVLLASEESLAIFQQIGNRWMEALALRNIAEFIYYSGLGNTAEAWSLLDQSKVIFEELEDQWMLGGTILTQAHLANWRGEYETAQNLYQHALGIYVEMENQWRLCNVRFNYALTLISLGDYEAAKSIFAENLPYVEETGQRSFLAAHFDCLGYADYLLNQFDSAESYYQRSLNLYFNLQDYGGTVMAYNNLGDIARARGDFVKAKELYLEAQKYIYGKVTNWWEAITLKNLGKVALETGQYAESEKLFRKALENAILVERIPDIVDIYTWWARLLHIRGQAEEAAAILNTVAHHTGTAKDILKESKAALEKVLLDIPDEKRLKILENNQALDLAEIMPPESLKLKEKR